MSFAFHLLPRPGFILLALLLSVAVVCAQEGNQNFPLTVQNSPVGRVWADAEGMTLYVYLRDGPEAATCTQACAQSWPPHEASAAHRLFPPAGFSVITHPDGLLQWAYKSQPLYRSNLDQQPGDIRGHGAHDAWWVAEPEPRHLDLSVPAVSSP